MPEPANGNPRNANGHRRRQLRARVLREETHCGICGEHVDKTLPTPDPFSAEIDEITPIKHGGDPLDRNNCQLAHRICNRCKSSGQHSGICPWCQTNGRPTTTTATYVTTRQW